MYCPIWGAACPLEGIPILPYWVTKLNPGAEMTGGRKVQT